ncbi:hypothetical protein BJX64DRAFT_266964 [Aspergillus heterothallicus]
MTADWSIDCFSPSGRRRFASTGQFREPSDPAGISRASLNFFAYYWQMWLLWTILPWGRSFLESKSELLDES